MKSLLFGRWQLLQTLSDFVLQIQDKDIESDQLSWVMLLNSSSGETIRALLVTK